MAGKLADKVAIVTGASSGIGEATALALAAEGAKVARIQNNGGQALPIVTDIADEAQVEHLIWQTHAAWGRVDILVNNAGVMLLGAIDGADTPLFFW